MTACPRCQRPLPEDLDVVILRRPDGTVWARLHQLCAAETEVAIENSLNRASHDLEKRP